MAELFDRLTAKVEEYERRDSMASGEVIDHYLSGAVGATIEEFTTLAVRAAMAMLPRDERTKDNVGTFATVWMMGAAAAAGAARGQQEALRDA